MVVAAHPDDELLGLGATMHKLVKAQGVQTRVIILGEGITSRSDTRDTEQWKEVLERHHQNVETARQLIGYHSVQAYNFSDNRFDSHALLDIVKVVEHEKEQFRPDFIFTHHGGDLNIDHQMTFQAVMTATRPITPRGRVDIVLRTKTTLYVMELKLDKSAGEAMEQIDLKNYPERFALCGLPVVKVAVSFDSERCTIGDWEIINA